MVQGVVCGRAARMLPVALGLLCLLVLADGGSGACAVGELVGQEGWQTAEAREDFRRGVRGVSPGAPEEAEGPCATETRYERLRFEAANMHVDRGRVLRQSGDMGGAINEFARALQIDPGNQAAAQELQVDARRLGRRRTGRA